MKKSILLLLMLFVMASNLAFAKTVDEATFTNEAKLAQLKVKKYEQTDIMGNEIKGVCVRHAPSKLLGFSGVKIFCNNNLDTSNMIISIGVSFIQNKNNESEIPVPKTIVINNKGNRVDIPVPNYKYDSGRSTLFGAWSEYNINVPLNLLADSGIEHIDGLSIIMVNPTTGTEGSHEAILTQKEKKDIAKINDIYSLFLKLNK